MVQEFSSIPGLKILAQSILVIGVMILGFALGVRLAMGDFEAFAWIVLGVFASSFLPASLQLLFPKPRLQGDSKVSWWLTIIYDHIKISCAGVIVGLITLAGIRTLGGSLDHWYHAVLAGASCEVVLQKAKDGFARNYS